MDRVRVLQKSPQTKEEQEALDVHNKARHDARGGQRPPLTWSTKLAEEAAAYARKQAKEGITGHDHQNAITKQGENLFFISHINRGTTSTPQPITLAAAVRSWLNEEKYYKGQKLKPDDPSGVEVQWTHYCTIIWPEATQVGMGRFIVPPGDSRYKIQGTFYVAKYDVHPLCGWSAWSRVRDEVMQLNDAEKSCDESGRHLRTDVIVKPDGTRVVRKTLTHFVLDKPGEGSDSKGTKRDRH